MQQVFSFVFKLLVLHILTKLELWTNIKHAGKIILFEIKFLFGKEISRKQL